jgi:hypothetical protein
LCPDSRTEDEHECGCFVIVLRPPMGDVKTALGCFFLVASVPAFFLSVEQGKRR